MSALSVTPMRLTSVVVLLLLTALFTWVARHTYWDDDSIPMPWKGEAARNPFYPAQRFAAALGARTEREGMPQSPPRDAVILLTAWNWGLSDARRERLERWVESGGRLVVDRTLITGGNDFETWSGIERHDAALEKRATADDGDEDDDGDASGDRAPLVREPGCHQLHDSAADYYLLCDVEPGSSLRTRGEPVWALADEHGAHLVRVRRGAGSITFIDAHSPFAGSDFFRGDHATLFALATDLRRGDQLFFVGERDSASLLTLAWRHGAPVLLLILLCMAAWIWRSSYRFGPLTPPPDGARRSLAEQIRGTGQFALRFGDGAALHAAALRALAEAAARHVPGYDRLTDSQRAAAVAGLTGLDAASLAPAMNFATARGGAVLRGALALLESARRRLLTLNERSKHGS